MICLFVEKFSKSKGPFQKLFSLFLVQKSEKRGRWVMSNEDRSKTPLRLRVEGYEGRCNDVLYCPPQSAEEEQATVVYFGGDIQDFNENMETHRDNKNYLTWSLDSTATILQNAFSKSHILVIRPSRMDYKTFSCFDNFVPSANCGVPDHVPMHHSLQHFEKLLENVSKRLKETTNDDQDLTKHNLQLIGFSKGCVVLNQFLHEFHTWKSTAAEETINIISRIKDMYWLDGGHSGGKNTWVTSKTLLETLSAMNINIHIHVSPYQINDDRRPWIKKEEKIFYNTLCSLKAPVERRVYFAEMTPSIFLHFKILDEFYKKHS